MGITLRPHIIYVSAGPVQLPNRIKVLMVPTTFGPAVPLREVNYEADDNAGGADEKNGS